MGIARAFRSTLIVCAAALFLVSGPSWAQCTDMDGDGFYPGSACGALPDCNDDASTTHPGAAELCDGYDNDCDGEIDDTSTCDRECDSPRAGLERRFTSSPDWIYGLEVAWTGHEYGVVWYDGRDTAWNEVYFARLDSSGNKIGNDLRVSEHELPSITPSIAWTGLEFGIVFSDDRNENGSGFDLYFVRLDAVGNKIGPDRQLTADSTAEVDPVVVWAGDRYGVAWTSWGNEEQIYFATYDRSGAPISGEVALTSGTALHGGPSLVWTGTEFAVAWEEVVSGNWEIFFRRIDAAGTPIGSARRVTDAAGHSYSPSLAWSGTTFGIAWHDYRDGVAKVYFASLDSAGHEIVTDLLLAPGWHPILTWNGEEWGLSSWDFMRLSLEGNLLSYPLDIVAGSSALVWNGSRYVLARASFGAGFFAFIHCNCVDGDEDGFHGCDSDCNDDDDEVFPGAQETCNGRDDDCDQLVDDHSNALDADGDAVVGACDVCPYVQDPPQYDGDLDSLGDACDNCPRVENHEQYDFDFDRIGDRCDNCPWVDNPSQSDRDRDSSGDACDNCPRALNETQEDADSDRLGDACDNCRYQHNPSQADRDADREGDFCDTDDGAITTFFHSRVRVQWDGEGFESWNAYRGDLQVLHGEGIYTQDPALVPLAERRCDLGVTEIVDGNPPPGAGVFFLITGNIAGTGVESGLGTDGAGRERPNSNPCP